ncbi:purine nucleoside permease [Novosphingobium mangrovi (ex Huang et al. 2023)]|uniref:Purine nucleoside permease n=1 Tax=Novosphingobium mangrovi (ex Huang et al. 2023) TaxID=2976432 RepID=A0ABT2I2D0_9SPHN|nr:purine nucleoside permease [Novosphingobium mangrovi (ex Huang et al. 2023)]MCT2398964.1 purine nucleoside permease [Novosphingobium mangrovi (ex Huang et al. 2023)]
MQFFRRTAAIIGACITLSLSSGTAFAEQAVPSVISACEPGYACETPLPVKVVIVSLFEIGNDEGDVAGEFQLWKERRGLTMRIPFPQSFHDLYYNPETQVLGMVTGIGTARSTAATMALGLDQRFDLTKAYWLVAGIAGIDPEDASIGSVAWSRYVVDGDLAHEIDPREIPTDWSFGYFPRGTKGPNDMTGKPDPSGGEVFQLNPSLEAWAYNLTKDIELPDSEEIAAERAKFVDYPHAQEPPFVLEGEQLSAMTFWHGKLMTDWANSWVRYWTSGKGEFVTSAMEDTGVLTSLTYLDEIGRANRDRVLVMRAGSNFTMPPPGVDAATYLLRENEGYAGLEAAVENLYTVGSKVVDELLDHWDRYEAVTP